jgi:hypothetical protein
VSTKVRAFLFVFLLFLTACARLDYDNIGVHADVVKGGQAQIDEGYIVDVNGLPGIWLAGHHTTHGAPFANLGNARIGDRVCVYGKCYTVFSEIIVPTSFRPGNGVAPLVLQTSWFGDDLLVLAH